MSRSSLPVGLVLVGAILVASGCGPGDPVATPPIQPGTPAAPREVNLIAKDRSFLPDALDLVPGESIRLHVINGGLEVHEAVIGDTRTQVAWEAAEAETEGAPPGPTPMVSVPPDVAGLRVVVGSGERVDVDWIVPVTSDSFIVGCHIPGHWEDGMRIPVRWVDAATSIGSTTGSSPAARVGDRVGRASGGTLWSRTPALADELADRSDHAQATDLEDVE